MLLFWCLMMFNSVPAIYGMKSTPVWICPYSMDFDYIVLTNSVTSNYCFNTHSGCSNWYCTNKLYDQSFRFNKHTCLYADYLMFTLYTLCKQARNSDLKRLPPVTPVHVTITYFVKKEGSLSAKIVITPSTANSANDI